MIRFAAVFAAIAVAAAAATEQDSTAFEKEVAQLTAANKTTILHFWAPWCSNCKSELANRRWANFIESNPDVEFVFITIWNDKDGREMLEQQGVSKQPNFRLLHHPNRSRDRENKVSRFLDLPVNWTPTTWIFRAGKQRFALNYGEVHFPLLQQLVRDTNTKW